MTAANEQLWQTLQQANCVNLDMPVPKEPLMPPWYLTLLEGGAAWIAAVLLLGFVGSFMRLIVTENIGLGVLIIGSVFVLTGLFFDRQSTRQQVFMSQLALVLGLCGLLCLSWGLWEELGHHNWVAWFISLGVLLSIHSLFIHNRLSVLLNGIGIGGCITGVLYQWQWMNLLPLIMLVLAIILCLSIERVGVYYGRICYLAYGLVCWTLMTQGLLILGTSQVDFFNNSIRELSVWAWLLPWLVSVLASVMVVGYIFNQKRASLRTPAGYAAMTGVLFIGFLAIPLSGLSCAVLFLLLGLQLHNRVFTSLALVSIPLFICAYYYSLTVSLLEKSLLLMALGVVLLLARWGVNYWLSQPNSLTSQEVL
ncbi:DUF4401 domain-containing protein [Shewanella psychrotolerans]|uniref:DUF4401 domain-containing protein n=1 Tax=Shewanella psychrotolerans TaxID=2864206 RepID=UPI001C65E807|nr:DUF4401 domain-containing protein [Shewanella psychrotolerans]QYJ99834.1 DUF4401 domain-containing protein [Shewanella psychrotolerans]